MGIGPGFREGIRVVSGDVGSTCQPGSLDPLGPLAEVVSYMGDVLGDRPAVEARLVRDGASRLPSMLFEDAHRRDGLEWGNRPLDVARHRDTASAHRGALNGLSARLTARIGLRTPLRDPIRRSTTTSERAAGVGAILRAPTEAPRRA